MMTVMMTAANQNFLNGNSKRAKQYPTSVQAAICSTDTARETISVFRNVVP